MKPIESRGDHRNIARSDLEKTVTTERATPAAPEVLGLGLHDVVEERVGLRQNASVVGHDMTNSGW